MPSSSKMRTSATESTNPADKSRPSPPNGLPAKDTEKPAEATSIAHTVAQDGEIQALQTSDEKVENGASSKSRSSSPTRAGSLLRRSSRRIPERQHETMGSLQAPKDIHVHGRLPSSSDEDNVKPVISVQIKEVDPESDDLGIESTAVISQEEDVARKMEEKGDVDRHFEVFDPSSPVTETTLNSHQQPFPTPSRPLASNSGFNARMDTISERSAESSEPENSRPVSVASEKSSPRPESVQVGDGLTSSSLPSPTPSLPHRPAPATAVIVEQASGNSPTAAELGAIGASMNTISSEDVPIRPTSGGRMRLHRVAARQSIDSVLKNSAPSGGTIDTSDSSALVATSLRSSSLQTAQASKLGKVISVSAQSQGNGPNEKVPKTTEFSGQLGNDSRSGRAFEPGYNAPSLFQEQEESEAKSARSLPRPAPSRQLHRTITTTSQYNPSQPPRSSNTPNGANGPNLVIPAFSSSSVYSTHSSTTSNKQDGYEGDIDQDSSTDGEKLATSSVLSGPNKQGSQRPRKLTPREAAVFASFHDPMMSVIARFHVEELLMCRKVVSFTCDPRAAAASETAAFVSTRLRNNFRRIQKPMSDFGYEVQRYCFKYAAGYDLSWQVRKIQVQRQRQGLGRSGGVINTPGGVGCQNIHGIDPRDMKYGVWAGNNGVSHAERHCGCDQGSCSGAGGSESQKSPILDVEIDTKRLSWGYGDVDSSSERGSERPVDDSRERPSGPQNLQNYGLWQRVTMQDKGKGVAKPTAETGSEDEKKQPSLLGGILQSLPQPALPIFGLARQSANTNSRPTSSTRGSALQTTTTTTGETPTTPRTRLSSLDPEDDLPPAPAPPLPENERLAIQSAVNMATDAILSLRNFMHLIEDTYYESQPDFIFRTQLAPHTMDDFRFYRYSYLVPQEHRGTLPRRAERTPYQSAAFAKYHDLVRKSDYHITATVLVLDEQTKIIKGILDAAEGLDLEEQPLRENGKNSTSAGDGTGEFMMAGALPHRDVESGEEGIGSGGQTMGGGDDLVHCASNGIDKKNLVHMLDCGTIFAKLSYACARAELTTLKHMSRVSQLDNFTYGLLMRLEDRLDRLEDDLLGLDNKGFSSTSYYSGYERGPSGTLHVHGSGAIRGPDSIVTPPGTSSWQPRTSNDTGGQDNSPKADQEQESQQNKSKRSNDDTPNSSQKSTTAKKTRQSVQAMRQSVDSMVSIIIARRNGRRIGIADTEERQSLNSQEWDYFDSATGKVIPSPDGVGDIVSHRQIGLRASHVNRRFKIQHGAGCPYDGDTGGAIHYSGWRDAYAERGIGLGLGTLGGTSVERPSPTWSQTGGNGESKTLPPHGDSATAKSSPVSSHDREMQQRCPGCGVDLTILALGESQPTSRINGNGIHRFSQGGPSQLGWSRRVMGPRGRKRASKYWFYRPSFRTPLVDEDRNSSSQAGSPSPLGRVPDRYEEEGSPCPHKRRRKQPILSRHEDTYNALIGQDRDTAERVAITERHGSEPGRQRQRLGRSERRQVQVVKDSTAEETRLIEGQRRQAESCDLVRTSWVHEEHATQDDDGPSPQQGNGESSGSGSGGSGDHGQRSKRRRRSSLLALGLIRTTSSAESIRRRIERLVGLRSEDRAPETSPSPGPSRGRARG